MEFINQLGVLDAFRPTYFELVYQESLTDLIKPALKYILTVFAQRYPQHLLVFYNYLDEVYALLSLVVEQFYLETCDAGFSENFTGLKRAVSVTATATRRLHYDDRRLALAMLVLVPYIKAKLNDYYDRIGGNLRELPFSTLHDDIPQDELSWQQRWQQLFRKTFPMVKAGYQSVLLGYQIAYLFGLTRYYSPWLHLSGQEIKRLSLKDMQLFSKEADGRYAMLLDRFKGRSVWMTLRRWIAIALYFGLDSLKTALPYAVFFFKFLEWWYSSGYSKANVQSLPVPPPPTRLPPAEGGIALPNDRSICPLCLKSRTNPAVLPSGYVFCYPCIYVHVEQHSLCPVTLMPTKLDQIRKIYV